MTDAAEALQRLREGNRRFVEGRHSMDALANPARRDELVGGQDPFAVVIGCADSRVPVEIVFDQGLGDLFVIRVAGNVVAPEEIGSVEYAAQMLGTPLVVVMGHTHCGAVKATINALQSHKGGGSRNLSSIVDRVRPAVSELLESDLKDDPEALEREAVRANVRAAAHNVRHGSEVLEPMVSDGSLLVVGAEYALETGAVDFFDGVPA